MTQADLQQAEATPAAAAASLASARAALDVVRLDLDHTVVKSPISGVAGQPSVSIGALVTSNQTDALATITRMQQEDIQSW